MRYLMLVALAAATGCANAYVGSAHTVEPHELAAEPGWVVLDNVPYVAQEHETECGAAAMGMVVSYWTGATPATIVQKLRPAPKRGIAAGKLRDFARSEGLASFVIMGDLSDLAREVESGRPVVVGLMKPRLRDWLTHYEVVVGIHRERGMVVTLDPDRGWRQNTVAGFLQEWNPAGRVALIISARTSVAEGGRDVSRPSTAR